MRVIQFPCAEQGFEHLSPVGPGISRGVTSPYPSTRVFFFLFFFFSHTSTFQLLDKPWSQVSSLLPPSSCLQFLSRIGFSNPTARRMFHRVWLTHALALSASQFVHEKKSPRIDVIYGICERKPYKQPLCPLPGIVYTRL